MKTEEMSKLSTDLANLIGEERNRCIKNGIPIKHLNEATKTLVDVVEHLSNHLNSMK